jgi:hypothetical protein
MNFIMINQMVQTVRSRQSNGTFELLLHTYPEPPAHIMAQLRALGEEELRVRFTDHDGQTVFFDTLEI